MTIFRENYCRICLKFFCCKRCRLEHEQDNHDIHPECDICVYGRTYLKTPSSSLLCHFKSAHWPLHCIVCKKLFKSTQELKLHSTCSVARKANEQEDSNVLIQSSLMEPNYDSPPITTTMHKSILTSSNKRFGVQDGTVLLTTSTPMQKTNEKELLEQIPEGITPVDYLDKIDTFEQIKSTEATRSNIKSVTNEQLKSTEPSLKRRVTFSEIEIINYQESKHSDSRDEEVITETVENENEFTADSSNVEADMYISAMEDTCDKSELYTTVPDTNFEESSNTSIVLQEDKNTCVDNSGGSHLYEVDTSVTMWTSAYLDLDSLIKSETPTSPLNKSSDKLNVDSNITDFNFFSSVTNQDSRESNIQTTDMEETSVLENQNSTKIIEDSSSSSSKNLSRENQNPGTSNILLKTSNVPTLRSSDILSAIIEDLNKLDNHPNKLIEILTPDVKTYTEKDRLKQSLTESAILALETKDVEELNNAFAAENHDLNNLGETFPSLAEFNFEPEISSSTINQNLTQRNCPLEDSAALTRNLPLLMNKETEKQNYFPEVNFKSTVIDNLSSKFGQRLMTTKISSTTSPKATLEEASGNSLSSDTTIKSGIWSSMTNALKTVVNGLSTSRGKKRSKKEGVESRNNSYKRTKSESDNSVDESPLKKRIKLTHIQCRRTIRNIRPFYELGYGKKKVKTCDKATQTDF